MVLESVKYCSAWYDGSVGDYDRQGDELPLGARIIAIVDAFDSMTTDHIYRNAMSRERAMAELFEYAGRQFDPDLVRAFCTLQTEDSHQLDARVARRWLTDLKPEQSDSFWKYGQPGGVSGGNVAAAELFHERLLDNMHDGVVFVDTGMQILFWNPGAERLTGISAKSVEGKHWEPEMIQMRDERGHPIPRSECPVAQTMQTGAQLLRRLTITNRGGQRITVNTHLVPVVAADGVTYGTAFQLHDASSETNLEERVQSLHEKATRDPLTQVANRAEFDRTLIRFVETHLQRSLPCSLIICDVDHFKRTNDTFGHQAGDEALICFASLLKRGCRPGDLVARYGGEEFVMLCADCDNNTATLKAERIRRDLAAIAQPVLNGGHITASFGVTELQSGDTPETMLRRADRALLQAKERGRNMVVQLGTGQRGQEVNRAPSGWFSWLTGGTPSLLFERSLITAVPLNVAMEKLRGFVADHGAEVVSIEEDHVVIRIQAGKLAMNRRVSDRSVPLQVECQFEEQQSHVEHSRMGGRGVAHHTLIHVSIRPRRSRDRRRRDAAERARKLLISLKSYLMAHECDEKDIEGDVSAGAHSAESASQEKPQPQQDRD